MTEDTTEGREKDAPSKRKGDFMTALSRWNPFEEMEAMQNRLSSFFDMEPARNSDQSSQQIEWAPLIDVIESPEEYIIRADLPGVSKDGVSVTLENGELLIKGARPSAPLAEGAEYLLQETSCGSFTRAIGLPANADAGKIHAAFKDGVLTVNVAKHEQAKPRAIEIATD
jgi:HSP20 family protein